MERGDDARLARVDGVRLVYVMPHVDDRVGNCSFAVAQLYPLNWDDGKADGGDDEQLQQQQLH